jgi:hypothetical protein
LDYSKIEAGKLEIDAIDFNLGNCLGDTMKTLSLRAHQKGLELAFEIEPDVPGNPHRWAQVSSHRAHGAVAQKPSCSFTGAAKQEKFQPLRGCFFLTPPFIELHISGNGVNQDLSKWMSHFVQIVSPSLG